MHNLLFPYVSWLSQSNGISRKHDGVLFDRRTDHATATSVAIVASHVARTLHSLATLRSDFIICSHPDASLRS